MAAFFATGEASTGQGVPTTVLTLSPSSGVGVALGRAVGKGAAIAALSAAVRQIEVAKHVVASLDISMLATAMRAFLVNIALAIATMPSIGRAIGKTAAVVAGCSLSVSRAVNKSARAAVAAAVTVRKSIAKAVATSIASAVASAWRKWAGVAFPADPRSVIAADASPRQIATDRGAVLIVTDPADASIVYAAPLGNILHIRRP